MAVTSDILRAWRNPRVVMRDHLDAGRREDRALIFVMGACFVIFIAQWPRLSRLAAGHDLAPGAEVPDLTQLMAYEFMAWIMMWPLMLYILGSLLHLLARAVGGRGSFYSARLALFWALLATTPVALLYGLCAGFLGPVAGTQLVGVLWLAGFAAIFGASLYEAEQRPEG